MASHQPLIRLQGKVARLPSGDSIIGTPAATTTTTGTVVLAGDLGGTEAAPSVLKINGVAVTGTPTAGQVITATSGTAASWATAAGGGGATVTAISANTTVTSATHGTNAVIRVTGTGIVVTLGNDFAAGASVTVVPNTQTTDTGIVAAGANSITAGKGTTLKTIYATNQAVELLCTAAGVWVCRSTKAARSIDVTLPFTLTDDEDDLVLNVGATGNLTVPTGLRSSFSCLVNVVTGTVSVLSSGGTLLNGAALTATRASGLNPTFAVIHLPTANSFRVTGF